MGPTTTGRPRVSSEGGVSRQLYDKAHREERRSAAQQRRESDPGLRLKSALPFDHAGDAIREYLGEHSSTTVHCHLIIYGAAPTFPNCWWETGVSLSGPCQGVRVNCRVVITINAAEIPQRIKSELEWRKALIILVLPRFVFYHSAVAYVSPTRRSSRPVPFEARWVSTLGLPATHFRSLYRCCIQFHGINGNLIDRQDDCTPDARPASGFRSQARITSQGPGDPPHRPSPCSTSGKQLGGMMILSISLPPLFSQSSPLCGNRMLFFSGKSQLSLSRSQLLNCNSRNRGLNPPPLIPALLVLTRFPERGAGCSSSSGVPNYSSNRPNAAIGDRQKRAHLLFRQYRGSLPAVIALQEAGPNPIFPGYCSYIGGTTTNLLAHKSYTAVQKSGAPSIHIFNCYCLPHLQTRHFRGTFLSGTPSGAWQPLVVVGDFNALRRH
ncbi:hypothetical protein HPB52_008697 [Rhipicephalus sanguineus]|uniref:Endonuclease/exonuclease/phosphatase domain-containing protein n=1 Tax=Rhipicephalus sanguineus TaxID=34632 RepID=A0A9D4PV40_RHISA|nr:hypothetical protein HPB52_008697 [Rhipicephalus sanguineus]